MAAVQSERPMQGPGPGGVTVLGPLLSFSRQRRRGGEHAWAGTGPPTGGTRNPPPRRGRRGSTP